jgi:hypothetical protein
MRAGALIDTLPRVSRPLARRGLAATRRTRLLQDEYVDWLLLLNAGMQHRGNPYLLDAAVRDAPAAPMLEIGSFCGLSAAIIVYLQRKHGREVPLFCCDSWVFEGSERPLPAAAPATRAQMREHARESFCRAMHSFSGGRLPFAVESRSGEFLRDWDEHRRVTDVFGRRVRLGGPLGFCFIDGDHSEHGARADFDGCDRHLLAGGLILFDDSGDETDWEVRRVVRGALASGRYEVLACNPNYLLRKLR